MHNNNDSILKRNYKHVVHVLAELMTLENGEDFESCSKPSISGHISGNECSFTEKSALHCICALILGLIKESDDLDYQPPERYSRFNMRNTNIVPLVEHSPAYILHVLTTFNTYGQIDYEYMVAGLIYFERILKSSNQVLRVCSRNWYRLLWTCLVIASKVWDDFAMCNSDYSQIFSNLPLPILNELETELLMLFKYELRVSFDEFAYYNNTFAAMILDAKLQNSFPQTSMLCKAKSEQGLLAPTETSNRTASIYSSATTTIDDQDDYGEDEDEEQEGNISPLLTTQLLSHRFSNGYHLSNLSPVLSEIISRSHSCLTPVDESKYFSSLSSCPSGASLPVGRKRLFSDDILKLKETKSDDILKLKEVKDDVLEVGNFGNHDENLREKQRIFKLLLQIRNNKIKPIPQSPTPVLNLPSSVLNLPSSEKQHSFKFFSKFPFRNFFNSHSPSGNSSIQPFRRLSSTDLQPRSRLQLKFFKRRIHVDDSVCG